MIDYIKGQLTYIESTYIVVETNGVGYQLQTGNPYQFSSRQEKEVCIYTYQYVREDILALYGFPSREERALFEKLLLVSGIGPKGALAILATGTPGQVITAIQSEDVIFLTKFPGVGKKTAQRLIIDLKDKLDGLAHHFREDMSLATHQVEVTGGIKKLGEETEALQEALEALFALGYLEKEIHNVLPMLKEKAERTWSTDQYIKQGLQLLMK